MERVTNLFTSFRNNEIAYDELFGALTRMVSEDPQFAAEAIATLDKTQQLTPIPVTDFIQLRSQMEATAETFREQRVPHTQPDAEATRIFSGDATATRTSAPHTETSHQDPTLIAAPDNLLSAIELPGEATATAQPAADDYADEATIIMPMPPRHEPTAPVSTPTVSANPSHDENATRVATPTSTITPASATTPPISPRAVTPEPAAESRSQKDKQKPLLALLVGIGAFALVVVLAVLLWPGDNKDAETRAANVTSHRPDAADSPWQSSSHQSDPTMASAEQHREDNTVFDELEQAVVEPASWNEESPTTTEAEASTEFFDTSNSLAMDSVAPADVSAETAPTAVKDDAYYLEQIKAAVGADRLTPASEDGTATWYLVALIRYDENSDKISDARTLISQRHLELAKKAREENQWDAAQQHLDDALKVRLPDSYLP